MLVIGVDQGYEGARIDEDHRRGLLFARCSRRRTPVRSDRFGGPPRTLPMRWAMASYGRGRRAARDSSSWARMWTASRTSSDLLRPFLRASRRRQASVLASSRTVIVISPPPNVVLQ